MTRWAWGGENDYPQTILKIMQFHVLFLSLLALLERIINSLGEKEKINAWWPVPSTSGWVVLENTTTTTTTTKNKECKDYKRLLFCVVTINDNIPNLGSKEILQVKGPYNARWFFKSSCNCLIDIYEQLLSFQEGWVTYLFPPNHLIVFNTVGVPYTRQWLKCAFFKGDLKMLGVFSIATLTMFGMICC